MVSMILKNATESLGIPYDLNNFYCLAKCSFCVLYWKRIEYGTDCRADPSINYNKNLLEFSIKLVFQQEAHVYLFTAHIYVNIVCTCY